MPTYPAPQRFRDEAHINEARYLEMYDRSLRDPDGFWGEQASAFLAWYSPWDQVCSHDFVKGHVRWFEGSTLNACYNCIDRHLPERADQVAIIWEGDEPDTQKTITYRELADAVGRLANALASRGVCKGDRVCIYMPMIPEAAYAMLACARIGAIHSVVFGGFSPQALKDRILDSDCQTLDHGRRRFARWARRAAEAERRRCRGGLPERAHGAHRATHRRRRAVAREPRCLVSRTGGRAACGIRACGHGSGRPAVHPVHVRVDGQAERRSAQHGRLFAAYRNDAQIRLRLPRRGHLLVHG